jgi:hypothetical protein
MAPGDDPSTEELRLEQLQREHAERQAAEATPDPEDAHAHERRADRAGYLREKLEEQAEADAE